MEGWRVALSGEGGGGNGNDPRIRSRSGGDLIYAVSLHRYLETFAPVGLFFTLMLLMSSPPGHQNQDREWVI